MKPEEQKARELYDEMLKKGIAHPHAWQEATAKQCALIAVDYATGEIEQYGFDDRIPFLEKIKEAITKLK